MANSYHKIYLQTIFAVKYRAATLQQSWRNELFGVIGNLINQLNCKTLIVNGVEDHVHCLLGLRPIVSVSELMKAVKARSSKYINDKRLTRKKFEWQDGFGVFSYSDKDLDNLYNYISSQEEHHRKLSFREEYKTLLAEFKIAYDDQYIFQELV